MPSKKDKDYMALAHSEAKKGAGFVSPNPLVGAVLVKDGRIIGRGYHQKFGSAHAEINAFESASESPAGSTLYCNLEPCCHTDKKTAPCLDRIIQEKVRCVVVSNLDPNPSVNGKGLDGLARAGIEVKRGVLGAQGADLNRFFFKSIVTKRPYISVKIAQSVDGRITRKSGEQTWLTGEAAREIVHRWRSEYDAVLVGAGTVIADDPRLNVRAVDGRDPVRVVLDGNLSISESCKLTVEKGRTIIVTSETANKKKRLFLKDRGCEFIEMPMSVDKGISLDNILAELYNLNISSLLVEGGQNIFTQFLYSGLADELNVFIAPRILGSGLTAVAGGETQPAKKIYLKECRMAGGDMLLTYRSKS